MIRRADTKPGSPPPPMDPRRARPEEHIGGGFLVFRRTAGTGRIRAPEWPFEWQTRELAQVEADRLSTLHPREVFQVFGPGADLAALERELGRLRAAFRVNMLRHVPGITDADIDALLAEGHAP